MKARELVYTIIDQAKILSDDSDFNEDEILFLLGKYRAFIIEQRYLKDNSAPSDSNFQAICIELEQNTPLEGIACGETYLRSVDKIPSTIGNNTPVISILDMMMSDNLIFVNKERIKFVGNRSYEKNFIYATIMADGHLWVKSKNPQYKYLEKVRMYGIFNDFELAHNLSCDEEDSPCDVLDAEFPMDDALVPTLIEAVLKDILGATYRPKDFRNNAMDDMSNIAQQASQQQNNQQNNQQ